MGEDEVRELQDPSGWDFEQAAVVSPVEQPGAVVAVRFAADDFARVARLAAESNTSVTAFVRDAVLEKVAHRPVR